MPSELPASDAPPVTVGVLCYNQQDMIGRVLAAVLRQVPTDCQIIVVDDGSSDDSAQVVLDHLSAPPLHRLIRHEGNRGRTAARNSIVEAADGDIILFVDGDAPPRPGWFDALTEVFKNPEIGGVGGRGIEVVTEPLVNRWRSIAASQGWGDQAADVPWVHGLCCAYRTHVLRAAGGFTGRGEDVDIGHRVRRLGYTVRYTPHAQVSHLRDDDLASLRHMLHRWFRGSYIVGRRWHEPAARRLAAEASRDHLRRAAMSLRRGDVKMTAVDVLTLWFKIEGLLLGIVEYRRKRFSGG